MARLADEVIDQIKSDVSLVRLVESQGYVLRKRGKDFVVHCPFHEDKTPSCVISPETNLFHCFGCGEGGSVIDWVMKTQGVSFRFACELLQKELGLIEQHSSDQPVKQQNTAIRLSSSLAADGDDASVLADVIEYYHQTLLSAPEANAYLQSRCLDDEALIAQFKLGFANRTLGYQLPAKNRKAGSELRSQLQGLGILRESGHEHFNGSLVIPVLDQQGSVKEVYGRKISGTKLRKGTPQHLYLPGEHQGVFNEAGLNHTDEVILCESLIDALTFWRFGFKHVTTSYGVQGFTEELHQALLFNNPDRHIKRVLIAYDRDAPGNRAAEQLATQLMNDGLECYRVLFPKSMDANSYACQMKPAQQALALVLRQAEWLGTGTAPLRSQLEQEAEPQTGQSQVQIIAPKPEQPVAPQSSSNDAEPTTTPECQPEPHSSLAAKKNNDVAVNQNDESVSAASTQAKVDDELNEVDLNASPVPPVLQGGLSYEIKGSDAWFSLESRQYRVRGWQHKSNASLEHLKVNVMVCNDQGFHTDTLDLYSSKQRQSFINQASQELGLSDRVLKSDVGQLLLTLESLLSADADDDQANESAPVPIDEADQIEAMRLLQSPNLLNCIVRDFEQMGVVGESINTLMGYLACSSRQLDRPLAVIIQSSSAAGKSALMEAVLTLMPEEDRVQYSAMTGQSLFYMGETDLKHKILAISEEEGAHNASYALKLLQSEGEVTIASTGKDDNSGELVTREYKVQGPVMLFLTTTAIDIDEELLNRCLVLTVNESRAQTQAIHKAQRKRRTLEGLRAKQQKQYRLKLHHTAQRLLKPLAVINPYADQLTFLDDKTRTRRDHEKYLTLIDSIALLHQYQREVKQLPAMNANEAPLDYIEVNLSDIEHANRLAHEVLGKTLDELPPQTRKLLTLIEQETQKQCQQEQIRCQDYRFSRRQVRQWCGWSETQVRVHMQRLVNMEYLLVHRGGRGQSFEYELLYQGEGNQGDRFLMGLLDANALAEAEQISKANTMTNTSRGDSAEFAAPSRPQRGTNAHPSNEVKATHHQGSGQSGSESSKKVYKGCKKRSDGHHTHSRPSDASELACTEQEA